MADISLNSVSYDGDPQKPVNIERKRERIGTLIKAADGTPHFVYRSSTKYEWAITWETAPAATRTAIVALAALSTTFSFTDEQGSSFTVQVHEGDYSDDVAFTSADNTIYYNVSLTIHQA